MVLRVATSDADVVGGGEAEDVTAMLALMLPASDELTVTVRVAVAVRVGGFSRPTKSA